MPKMKSNSGANKRFRRKSSGAVKRGQSHRRHILTKKSTKRKRQLRTPSCIASTDIVFIDRLLPYK
ncbi:MAG: 50S ribosomal protein L35 [Gammaproteobacteria bacterium]|nr:50S ribosomal protein L35 [Gammaproteobacteria bacterium]